ncbi:TPA: cyclophilin-like fold protein [Klebsiella pneumoniae]|nr:cyclophilin-like fold protein [Klebsiella pneumoniae]
MKKSTLTLMQNAYRRTSLLLLAGLIFFTQSAMASDNDRGVAQETLMKIEIIVEGETATATLYDTPTGRDFASLLPLSLTLEDYDDIERISDLPRRLSTVQAPDGMTPEAGDITYYAPWGNLAIFARGRAYGRSLIPLGKVDSGLPVLQRHGPLAVQIRVAN